MALDVEKGSFARQSGTGNQTITLSDTGMLPKVMFLWGTNQTSTGVADDITYFMGWTVSTGQRYCYGHEQSDNETILDLGNVVDKQSLYILKGPGVVDSGIADFVSFNTGNFIINWSTNDGTLNIIHYMVLGGSDLTNVFAGDAELPYGTGNFSITGVGFQPKVTFFLKDVAKQFEYPSNEDPILSFGAAKSSTERFAITGMFTGDPEMGPNDDSATRHISTTRCMILTEDFEGATVEEYDFVSHDGGGFTLNAVLLDVVGETITSSSVANPTNILVVGHGLDTLDDVFIRGHAGSTPALDNAGDSPYEATVGDVDNLTIPVNVTTGGTGGRLSGDPPGRFAYLCLGGTNLSVSIGSETQRTSTGTKAKTGIGFQPEALLVASVSNTGNGSADGVFSFGASDGTNEGVAGMLDEDAPTTNTKSNSFNLTDKIMRMALPGAAPSVNAEADLSSFDTDGFTLNWTTADATARQFAYVALRGAAAGGAARPQGPFGHVFMGPFGGPI